MYESILENSIREAMPSILKILLIDRTTSTSKKTNNIIWANNNYKHYGYEVYDENDQITPNLVTGPMSYVIVPRALKEVRLKKLRTREKAEVFTPTWIVKSQNDEIDKQYSKDDLETYVKRKWLEITCGEAPYMTTRYDMNNGKEIDVKKRVGFVDRKLQKINDQVTNKDKWNLLVSEAFKSSYGYEWNGDSLLLARENLLYTYCDYYFDKWSKKPKIKDLKKIAIIISYNVFQMDGLKWIIPLTDKKFDKQLSLFSDYLYEEESLFSNGKYAKIMNWQTNKMEYFYRSVE